MIFWSVRAYLFFRLVQMLVLLFSAYALQQISFHNPAAMNMRLLFTGSPGLLLVAWWLLRLYHSVRRGAAR
jgi:hypothetical protein